MWSVNMVVGPGNEVPILCKHMINWSRYSWPTMKRCAKPLIHYQMKLRRHFWKSLRTMESKNFRWDHGVQRWCLIVLKLKSISPNLTQSKLLWTNMQRPNEPLHSITCSHSKINRRNLETAKEVLSPWWPNLSSLLSKFSD